MEVVNIKTLNHENLEVSLRSDGIVHVHIYAHTNVTVELQGEMAAMYNSITKVKRPFVFTGDEFVSITAKARKNAVDMAVGVPILCTAIITRNLAQKILADYYYKFNKPPDPYNVFKDFDKGIEWLKENFEIPPISE